MGLSRLGPIFYYRGGGGEQCQLSALHALPEGEGPPALSFERGQVTGPVRLAAEKGRCYWSYAITLPLADAEAACAYRLGEIEGSLTLPGRRSAPRIAYASCNGWEAESADEVVAERRYGLWSDLAKRHEERPFHLLLMGGDQIYADTIWTEIPALAQWLRLPRRKQLAQPLDPGLAEQIRAFYFERYHLLWSRPEISDVFATVPVVMMWDDHDIFDGWGSRDPDWQACPVVQGIWRAARQAFALFQLGMVAEDPAHGFAAGPIGMGHFGWAGQIGPVAMIVPDLRSDRSRDVVMGEQNWAFFEAALARARTAKHLLVVSSVPLVNLDFSPLERVVIRTLRMGHDDLRDQWLSYAHREEWTRMMRALAAFGRQTGIPVTIVSGEIHLAALGRAELEGTSLFQLIASGIVHPPPPSTFARLLSWLARKPAEKSGIHLQMLPMSGSARYLAALSWLELAFGPAGELAARWRHDLFGSPESVDWRDPRGGTGGGRDAGKARDRPAA